MAAEPVLARQQLSYVPSKLKRYGALQWSSVTVVQVLVLFLLCMVKVFLFAWSKTDQERLDEVTLEVQNVRAATALTVYHLAAETNGAEISAAELTDYQRVTTESVDRISVPAALATQTRELSERNPEGEPVRLDTRSSLRETVRECWRYIFHGDELSRVPER